MTGSQGGGGGGDKQFKQPVGPQPGQVTQEFTPLQAGNWQADKKLFVKTCSNLQTLSTDDQKTPMKRYVSTAMWPLVEVGRGDGNDDKEGVGSLQPSKPSIQQEGPIPGYHDCERGIIHQLDE